MTITEGVAALGQITPVVLDNITTVLNMFMTVPLVFFTGAAFVIVGFKIVVYLFNAARNLT
jgi:hypothetical protein